MSNTAKAPLILFVGRWDWAGLCNRIARALNAHVGERVARVATERSHPFGYEEDWVVEKGRIEGFHDFAREADWIISTGDGEYDLFEEVLGQAPLKETCFVGTTHAGTVYRRNATFYNAQDKRLGARARFIGSDSLYLAEGDPTALPYFGTCDPVTCVKDPMPNEPIRVSHSASNRAKKGSEVIWPVLQKLEAGGFIQAELIEGVSAAEALERRSRAHVHVDQIVAEVGGFGQAAIEAMGVGCAVLADMRHVSSIVKRYVPIPPIVDVRDARELEDWLMHFFRERQSLARLRQEALSWSHAHSAPEAVARYWLHHLERLGKRDDQSRIPAPHDLQTLRETDRVSPRSTA